MTLQECKDIQNIIKLMSIRKIEKRTKKDSFQKVIEIVSDSECQMREEKGHVGQGSQAKKGQWKQSSYAAIPQIPEVKLSKQDMHGDPVGLLVGLEQKFEEFGAVKIITPPEWKPPFCFKYTDKGITTRIQHLHKLKYGKSFKEREEAYNIRSFTNFAKDYEKNYRFRCKPQGETPEQKEEEQYWDLIRFQQEGPEWKFKTTVEYAADLPVGRHGSGFPLSSSAKTSDEHFNYHDSFFNLNNIYKSPLSIFKIADDKNQKISGVTVPWVYMGMMFSTFCWHVEDLWLNSLNYSHVGATKTWYVIPRKDKEKFDEYVKRKTGRTDLLNRITYMLDPLEVMEAGITVYRADQRPGEYICTFFKAYHSGFSHGFNVGEAVNFASPRSLDIIKEADQYSAEKKGRPSVLSYEWLVYENKKNNYLDFQPIMKSEYEKILKKQMKFIEKSKKLYSITLGSQISDHYKYDHNSCSVCRNYLYLSSLKCQNCGKNYCQRDLKDCCNGKFKLIHRKLNEDRVKITKAIKS